MYGVRSGISLAENNIVGWVRSQRVVCHAETEWLDAKTARNGTTRIMVLTSIRAAISHQNLTNSCFNNIDRPCTVIHERRRNALTLMQTSCTFSTKRRLRRMVILLVLLLNFITDSLLHTCAGKYDSCPNYKDYNKDTTLVFS